MLFRLPVDDLPDVLGGLMILFHSPVSRELIPRLFAAVTPGENEQPCHQLCGKTKAQPMFFVFSSLEMEKIEIAVFSLLEMQMDFTFLLLARQ